MSSALANALDISESVAAIDKPSGHVQSCVGVDFPGFARHQIALKSNSMRGVYERQTIHRRIQARSRKAGH